MHAELAAVPDSLYRVTRANRVIAVVRRVETPMFDIFDIIVPRLIHCSGLSTRHPERTFRHADATGVYIHGVRIGSTVVANVAYRQCHRLDGIGRSSRLGRRLLVGRCQRRG